MSRALGLMSMGVPIRRGAPNFNMKAYNPTAWFVASKGAYQDTGGATSVSDGSVVSLVQDQSGNGYHLTQPTATTVRPTWMANSGYNGQAGIRFTAANSQFLQNTGFTPIQNAAGGTWVLAMQIVSHTGGGGFVSTTQDQLALTDSGGQGAEQFFLNSSAAQHGDVQIQTFHGLLLTGIYDGSQATDAGKLRLFRNRVQKTLTLTGGPFPTTLYAGGSTLYFGRQAAGGYTDFILLEAVYFARGLSASDRAAVEGYLAGKYFTKSGKQLVGVGDSITAGYPNATNNTLPLTGQDSFPLHLQVLLGPSLWSMNNQGQTGMTWGQIQNAANTVCNTLRDDWLQSQVIVAMAGTNDLYNGTTVASIESSISATVSQYQAQGFIVGVGTILNRINSSSIAGFDAGQAAINSWIKAGSSGANFYIDYLSNPNLTNPANLTYFESDGLHPNDAGHTEMAKTAYAAMKTAGYT